MQIRPITSDEMAAYWAVVDEAFNSSWPFQAAMERESRPYEFDRTLVAFDNEVAVATATAFSFEMTVPGRVLPVAGVTGVGVMPSHRRRGLLTELMNRQLAGVKERGQEAVAALWASEAAIYGRFGYGSAADGATVHIPSHNGRFHADAPEDPSLRLRIAAPKEVRSEAEQVFDAVRPLRPGMYRRSDPFWDEILDPADYQVKDAGSRRCVIAEDETGPRGYAVFSIKEKWDERGPAGEIDVIDMAATDDAAYVKVWRHLLDRDLIGSVRATRPVDDPILDLLADRRQAVPKLGDNLWIRLVDLPRALESRTYSAPLDVVIDVADSTCPWNAGRWRLIAEDGKGICSRSDEAPDLVLDVSALGAALLGGRSLTSLVSAGRITEETPGSAAALSVAMSWEPRPWCPQVF